MPRIAFRLVSGGLGPASYTSAMVAFHPAHTPAEPCPTSGGQERLFRFGRFGSGGGLASGPVVIGCTHTVTLGGFEIPNSDSSSRILPGILAGKGLEIELGGCAPIPFLNQDIAVKLTFFRLDSHRRRQTMYEDTFQMPMQSIFPGGVKVAGTLESLRLWSREDNHQDLYNGLMDPFDDR